MNILFVSLLDYDSFEERNIYTDLLREFMRKGHRVVAVSPFERKVKKSQGIISEGSGSILKVRIGNTQKVNFIQKGISTVLLERQILSTAKKYLKDIKFDLIVYTTPPITFQKVISYFKERDHAGTYLLLKDIFPQNALDLGILTKTGLKGVLYSYFRKKEERLYEISDCIGCMSEANVNYLLKNNPRLNADRVMVSPNAVEIRDLSVSDERRNIIRDKYHIPKDKVVFVYGGNLGKPQGIDFLLEFMKSQADNSDVFFLIIGSGTEYFKIENYVTERRPRNMKLMQHMPKKEYDDLIGSCDIGMIFLDKRFTIPNFPSRILSYLQAKLPILVATDKNTDMGKVVVDYECGWWCESSDVKDIEKLVKQISVLDESTMKKRKENSWKLLCEKYDVKKAASEIVDFYSK